MLAPLFRGAAFIIRYLIPLLESLTRSTRPRRMSWSCWVARSAYEEDTYPLLASEFSPDPAALAQPSADAGDLPGRPAHRPCARWECCAYEA
ncbi:hypothetical protein ACTMU2_15115 [Cupriavidus basilensis]